MKVGGASDDIERQIVALDNSRPWQQIVCGGGGTYVAPPASAPPCNGAAGSTVTNAKLASYLQSGPAGFITVDFKRFFADTNYGPLEDTAPVAVGAATSARTGGVEEKTHAFYTELNGNQEVFGHSLRYNAGVRHVSTDQTISGPTNTALGPGPYTFDDKNYKKWLPAFNVAYNLTDNIVTRAAASKTLTRPDPSQMIPAVQVHRCRRGECQRG